MVCDGGKRKKYGKGRNFGKVWKMMDNDGFGQKKLENDGKISIWTMAGLAGLAEKLWKMMEKYRFGEWPGWLG